jgi:hypothetical protein
MAPSIKFNCYKSITGGMVASGTVRGVAGGHFEERPVWYGCQGESWPELQAGITRLADVMRTRVSLDTQVTPVEAFIKVWREDEPLLIPPLGDAARLFDNLVNVGTRRRGFVERVDDIQIISFLKIGALAVLRPTGAWKPELVSSFLAFAISLVPEHPTPIPEKAGQTPADLVEEILLANLEV